DRSLLRRRGRGRGDDVRARAAPRSAAADDQLPAPGSGLRSGLRAERGARGSGRRRSVERDGPRRPQRLHPARPRVVATIRAGTLDDATAVAPLLAALYPNEVLSARSLRHFWDTMRGRMGRRSWAAEAGGELIGFAFGSRAPSTSEEAAAW